MTSLESLRRDLKKLQTRTSTDTPFHSEATRLQTDSNNVLTWTFSTAFSTTPVITACSEGNSASIAAGYLPINLVVITSNSTTAVSIKTDQPNTWVHLTATEPT